MLVWFKLGFPVSLSCSRFGDVRIVACLVGVVRSDLYTCIHVYIYIYIYIRRRGLLWD